MIFIFKLQEVPANSITLPVTHALSLKYCNREDHSNILVTKKKNSLFLMIRENFILDIEVILLLLDLSLNSQICCLSYVQTYQVFERFFFRFIVLRVYYNKEHYQFDCFVCWLFLVPIKP